MSRSVHAERGAVFIIQSSGCWLPVCQHWSLPPPQHPHCHHRHQAHNGQHSIGRSVSLREPGYITALMRRQKSFSHRSIWPTVSGQSFLVYFGRSSAEWISAKQRSSHHSYTVAPCPPAICLRPSSHVLLPTIAARNFVADVIVVVVCSRDPRPQTVTPPPTRAGARGFVA